MVKIFCIQQQQQQQQHQIKDNNKQQESKRNNIYVPYDLCYNITSDFYLYQIYLSRSLRLLYIVHK